MRINRPSPLPLSQKRERGKGIGQLKIIFYNMSIPLFQNWERGKGIE
jgi:hypothetical protein